MKSLNFELLKNLRKPSNNVDGCAPIRVQSAGSSSTLYSSTLVAFAILALTLPTSSFSSDAFVTPQDPAAKTQDPKEVKKEEAKAAVKPAAGKTDPKQAEPDGNATEKKDGEKKDGEKKEASPAAPEGYLELMTAWKELESKLKAKEAEFVVVGAIQKDVIRKEYDSLLAEVKVLIPKLQSAAIDAYQKNPNQDITLVRLLIGMLTDHLAKNRDDDFFKLGQILIDGKVDIKHFEAIEKSKRLVSFDVPEKINELIARHQDAQKGNLPRAVIKTSYGDIELELFEDSTPNHVANFVKLASEGFYTNSEFHRVDPSVHVVQGGQPADKEKELDYTLAAEWEIENPRYHFKGALGAARTTDPNSASSQFYLMTERFRSFDGSYTVFGRVISGMEFVHQIKPGDKMLSVEITRKRDHEYVPTKYDPAAGKNPEPKKSTEPAKQAPDPKTVPEKSAPGKTPPEKTEVKKPTDVKKESK